MAEKTWDEAASDKVEEFRKYVEDQMKRLKVLEDSVMSLAEKVVEQAEKKFEPGMDYYGVDSLSQMGFFRKLTTYAEDIPDLCDAEELLKGLEKDLKTALSNLKD